MIIDIIFFVFIIAFAALGFVFGFFKTLVSFCGWFVSMLIAYLLAKAIANAIISQSTAQWLVGEGSLYDKVYGIIPQSLKDLPLQSIRDALQGGMDEGKVSELIGEHSVGAFFLSNILKNVIYNDIYLESTLQNVGQVLALELTYDIYVILVGVALFLVLRIIMMGVSIIFRNKIDSIPLQVVGRVVGLALGAVRGLLYACFLIMIATFISGMSATVKAQVDGSKVGVPATSVIFNATEQLLSGGKEDNAKFAILVDTLEQRLKNDSLADV